MEAFREGIAIALTGMAATFVVCAAVIGLSVIVRKLAGGSGASRRPGSDDRDNRDREDEEIAAAIAAVSVAMGARPYALRAVKRADEFGKAWEQSVREELAGAEGGLL